MAPGLDPLWAAALGALQGATEFLPVSSSGHLSLAQSFLGIDPEAGGHRFNITVHAGTLVAVLWTYRGDLRALLAARPTKPSPQRDLVLAIAVATIPLGLVLIPAVEAFVVAMEGRPWAVGLALWATAAILGVALWAMQREGDGGVPSLRIAAAVGLAQLAAVMPGISRSGATITAGLLGGLRRDEAARFSFLISIPAIIGASVKEGLALATAPAPPPLDPVPYVVGFVASAVVGWACLRWLLALVSAGRLAVFVVYLVGAGAAAVALGW